MVAEETADNIIRLLRGYDLIASDAENARTYYHYASDEMGSITHVVNGREVLNHYKYDAWRNLTVCEETVSNRFRFNGQQYDPVAQQYYLRSRFYNPVIARFTQEDTYRGDGLNLYAYCENNLGANNGGQGGNAAHNLIQYEKLKEYYIQAEKYGTGSIKELDDGRIRFYEKLKPASKPGEMTGARHVREWDPNTGAKRDWYETLDHYGNIRQVRPDPHLTGGIKVINMFGAIGEYIGKCFPE